MPIPFLVYLFLVNLITATSEIALSSIVFTVIIGLPVASLAGTVAGLFGPRGRQATDALQVSLPALNIVTLVGAITLGLTAVPADIAFTVVLENTSVAQVPTALATALAFEGSILIGLLATLLGSISAIIGAAMLSRWGWFAGLLFGMVCTFAIYVACFLVHAFGMLPDELVIAVPLVYCVCLITWSTGQVSRTVRRTTSIIEVRT
jgi:hypothetical protein